MSCQLLIGNRVGDKGELMVIGSSTHVWTHNETFKSWRLKFPETEELEYLSETLEADDVPLGPRWSFLEPDTSTDLWEELLTTGEVTLPWSVVSMYLKENT